MTTRYLLAFLGIFTSLSLFIAVPSAVVRVLAILFFLFFVIALINKTDFFYKEPFAFEDETELVDSRAEPVSHQAGNERAVLLIHGFSSSPWLFHKHLPLFKKAGYDVFVPRLPGHGTTPESFLKSSFAQYHQCVQDLFREKRKEYKYLHVIGASMGGLIALKLAEDFPRGDRAADSITTLATPVRLKDPRLWLLRIIGWFRPVLKGNWDPFRDEDGAQDWFGYEELYLPQAYSALMGMIQVRQKLSRVFLPHLMIHSKGDKEVPFENLREIAGSTSSLYQSVWVPDLSRWNHSKHSLFLYDSLKEELFLTIQQFIRSVERSSASQ